MDRPTHSDEIGNERAGARTARVLCCITFHFVVGRLESLADVLQALSEFSVALLEVVIVTNAIDEGETAILRRLAVEIMGEGRATICRVDGLEHPFDLAWHHKQVLAARFPGDAVSGFTHFVYLEDDIRFTFANFEYFLTAREHLRGAGLLPAFLRTEWSRDAAGLVATDCFWPVYVPVQPCRGAGEMCFINMPNPYNPCFVLDRELAREHLASPASDRVASSRLVAWGVRERAAMGLCLDNVPKPFRWRYVVPLSTASGGVPPSARVRHLQNTYAAANSGLAKTRVENLFQQARAVSSDWWPRIAEPDGSPRFFLVTHHDTIVYFDWTTMTLRHGPLGIVPFNLTVALLADEATLTASDEEGRTHSVAFQSEAAGDDCIGLKHANRYACADSGGHVRVDRSVLSDWETFGLMRTDTVNGIGLLADHGWRSNACPGIVRLEAQPITFWPWQASPASALAAGIVRNMPAAQDGIRFGKARIRLVTRKPQLEFSFDQVDGRRQPARAAIVQEDGAIFSFSRVSGDG
jgi:hypothetical protein